MTERSRYFNESCQCGHPETRQDEAQYYREAAGVYRLWIQNVKEAKLETYDTESNQPDPNIFVTPAMYGKPRYSEVKLPETIIKHANALLKSRDAYYNNCFSLAAPELAEEFISFWTFHNWSIPYGNTYTLNGTKYSEIEVYKDYRAQMFNTREQYCGVVNEMALLMDEIASYLEAS